MFSKKIEIELEALIGVWGYFSTLNSSLYLIAPALPEHAFGSIYAKL